MSAPADTEEEEEEEGAQRRQRATEDGGRLAAAGKCESLIWETNILRIFRKRWISETSWLSESFRFKLKSPFSEARDRDFDYFEYVLFWRQI